MIPQADRKHDVDIDDALELIFEEGTEGMLRRKALVPAIEKFIEAEGLDYSFYAGTVHRELLRLAKTFEGEAPTSTEANGIDSFKLVFSKLTPDDADQLIHGTIGPDAWEDLVKLTPTEQAKREREAEQEMRDDERLAKQTNRREEAQARKDFDSGYLTEEKPVQFGEDIRDCYARAESAIRTARVSDSQRQQLWQRLHGLREQAETVQFNEGPSILAIVREVIGRMEGRTPPAGTVQFSEGLQDAEITSRPGWYIVDGQRRYLTASDLAQFAEETNKAIKAGIAVPVLHRG